VSQRLIAGVLCVEAWSKTKCTSRSGGLRRRTFSGTPRTRGAMPRVQRADDLAWRGIHAAAQRFGSDRSGLRSPHNRYSRACRGRSAIVARSRMRSCKYVDGIDHGHDGFQDRAVTRAAGIGEYKLLSKSLRWAGRRCLVLSSAKSWCCPRLSQRPCYISFRIVVSQTFR
jgi:hypothetical protein